MTGTIRGTKVALKKGGPNRNLAAAKRVEDERVEGAQQNDRSTGGEQQIVEDQRAFARYRREQPAAFKLRGADRIERQRATDHKDQQAENKDAALGIAGEGVDRGQDARAHQEGAEQGHGEGQDGEQDRPAF